MTVINARIASLVVGFGVLVVSATFPASTLAADLDFGGWSDGGSYDTWADIGSYDSWGDIGSYGEWTDWGTFDSWSDGGSYDTWSDWGTYDSWSDGGSYDTWSDWGTYDTWSDVGTHGNVSYYDDKTTTYYDDAVQKYNGGSSYSTPRCASCGGNSTGGGYSISGGSSYRPISYSSSIPGWIGWSGSSYVPPKTPTYPTYPTPTKPVVTGGGSISNTTITNVDNSIRDSFNNYNSGNTTIVGTPIAQTPIYTPPMQNLYCVISATPNTVQNGSYATLSWTSSGATSAWLSDGLGSVAVNGSKMVIPDTSRTYTLTVYGTQGTQSCSTYVNVSGSYVALTQIPYTGFDLGPMGNTLYWAGLAAFALGGAYLMTYMVPGMSLAFAGTASQRTYQPVVAPKAPLLIEREAAAEKLAPIVQSLRAQVTTDTMAIVQKEGSMPKIVIARS